MLAGIPSTIDQTNHRRTTFFGMPLDLVSRAEIVATVDALIASGETAEHACLSPTTFVHARDDPSYFDTMARHRYVTADGQGLVWAGRLLGLEVPERVSGADLMIDLLELADRRRYAVYLLGARPDVLADAEAAIVRRYPGLVIAGRRDGYFTAAEERRVVEEIASSGAQLLFVAMPSPHKESFALRHHGALGVSFVLGVGGMFDILAGRIRRAPRVVQRLGLEWAFRVAQEPRRLLRRYVVGNTRFLLLVAMPIIRTRVLGRPGGAAAAAGAVDREAA